MLRTSDPSAYGLTSTEWELLYLLHDALGQLRKLTLSFSELRYLAVEHTEADIRQAVEALLDPVAHRRSFPRPLVVQVPNLAHLPIYRILPEGRDLVKREQGYAPHSTAK